MWEAGAMMHFLQVTVEGGENKKKISKRLWVPFIQPGAEHRSCSHCLSWTWGLLEKSCLLSHFGMGGVKSGSWVFFPFFRVSFYLCCCVGLDGSALPWGSSTFLFQGLQGKIFVACLLLLWSWRLLLSLPCTNLYPAHDIDLKNGFFSSDPHLSSSWVWHIPSCPPCLLLANFACTHLCDAARPGMFLQLQLTPCWCDTEHNFTALLILPICSTFVARKWPSLSSDFKMATLK